MFGIGLTRTGLIIALALVAGQAHALMRGEVTRDTGGTRRSTVSIQTPEGICTGTAIGPRLVVTAAHCLAQSGRYRLFYADTRFRLQAIGVSRVQSHPGFEPANGFSPDDIGLIELSRPLPSSVVPATLPTWIGAVSPGEDLLIAGFGSTDQAGGRDGVLRQLSMRATETPVPGRSFAGLSGEHHGGRAGMCVGDSGGPVYRRRNGELVLVGILKGGTTEEGKECTARPVYTPISNYVSWVRNAAIGWGLSIGPAATHEMQR